MSSALAARDARDVADDAAETAAILGGAHVSLRDRHLALHATVRDENQVVAQLLDGMRRLARDVFVCGCSGNVTEKEIETETASVENTMKE